MYLTNHNRENIKQAVRELSCAAGIEHRLWYNPGSTWYGDARRVQNLAKLTVALNKFGRAQMFGPGTTCRCSTCVQLPKECEWGTGPYAGTMLLYLQEIAINRSPIQKVDMESSDSIFRILTKEEWNSLPVGVLDQGVTSPTSNICDIALLHCM